jgi:hypothetical protein
VALLAVRTSLRAPRRALALILAASSAACSSPSRGSAYADVIFQGSADEGALTAVLAVPPADDPVHAAYFDDPKDLSALPGTPIITFAWHDGQTPEIHAPADLDYLLAFRSLDTDEALFRVFTSSTSFTPDAATWAKIATGTWTTLQVTSAAVDGDRLAAGSAPIGGQLIKFCIGTWQ